MIIPGLIDSIVKIIDVLPESMSRLMEWADMKLQNFPVAQSRIDSWINHFTENAIQFVYRKGTSGIHYDRNQCISRTDRSTECIEKLFYCDHHLCLFPEQQGSVCGTE